jgi:hypothetical protein
MQNNPFTKPLTLIEDQVLQATGERLGFEFDMPIDDQRRLRAENFASRIVAMLTRVENPGDLAEAYTVIATYAYNADAKIVSLRDDSEAA